MNVLAWWSELDPEVKSELLDNPSRALPDSTRTAVLQAGGEVDSDGSLAGLFGRYTQERSLLRAMDEATETHRLKAHEYLNTTFSADIVANAKPLTRARLQELEASKGAMDTATNAYYALVKRPRPGGTGSSGDRH